MRSARVRTLRVDAITTKDDAAPHRRVDRRLSLRVGERVAEAGDALDCGGRMDLVADGLRGTLHREAAQWREISLPRHLLRVRHAPAPDGAHQLVHLALCDRCLSGTCRFDRGRALRVGQTDVDVHGRVEAPVDGGDGFGLAVSAAEDVDSLSPAQRERESKACAARERHDGAGVQRDESESARVRTHQRSR